MNIFICFSSSSSIWHIVWHWTNLILNIYCCYHLSYHVSSTPVPMYIAFFLINSLYYISIFCIWIPKTMIHFPIISIKHHKLKIHIYIPCFFPVSTKEDLELWRNSQWKPKTNKPKTITTWWVDLFNSSDLIAFKSMQGHWIQIAILRRK